MKKIIYIFAFLLLIISCNNISSKDVRMIKVGTSTRDVKYFLGEPFEVQINDYGEEWYYSYDSESWYKKHNTLCITIVNRKVSSFYSY